MRMINLGKGKFALVDDEDFEMVNGYTWCISHGYAARGNYSPLTGETKVIQMHRELMGFPALQIDHIDGNRLNNQKGNLRLCSHKENCYNKGIPSSNTSGYKGVDWYKGANKWRAKITYNYKTIHLGYFLTKEDAARAYDRKAVELFGEFARLNLPQEYR